MKNNFRDLQAINHHPLRNRRQISLLTFSEFKQISSTFISPEIIRKLISLIQEEKFGDDPLFKEINNIERI